jgi:hypothetical protein
VSAKPVRIAMWSGPRNFSAAMMRSWGNRPDTFVCDEPYYAHHLTWTKCADPDAEEVMRLRESTGCRLITWLPAYIPEGKSIFLQKRMARHLLSDRDRYWLTQLDHFFLIRDPRDMLASLAKNVPDVTLEDTGLPQQLEIFEWLQRLTGAIPPVLDARDVQNNPRASLSLLCERLKVEFHDTMLSWPPGPRAADGAWAMHWHGAVENSTGFWSCEAKPDPVPEHLTALLTKCVRYYELLARHRLRSTCVECERRVSTNHSPPR